MQPTFKVVAQGSDITALIADRLVSLEVVDQAGVESDSMVLELDDRDQRFEFPARGVEIEVSLGYVGQQLVKMGIYTVDEVEVSGPPRTLTIRAKAADMTGGIKAPKERSWDEVTLGVVVQTIAGEHDLEPAIEKDLAERWLGHIDQTESDMQLLTRLCAEQGAIMKIADGRLIVAKHASGETASGLVLPAGTIDSALCESWSATTAERSEYESVRAYWHDLATGLRTPVDVGDGEPALELKHSYASEGEARQAAESKLKSLNRAIGKASLKGVIGDPYLAAEQPVSLVGFRRGVDGDNWVITKAHHKLDDSGYTCDVDLEARE
jgi:phage protein D